MNTFKSGKNTQKCFDSASRQHGLYTSLMVQRRMLFIERRHCQGNHLVVWRYWRDVSLDFKQDNGYLNLNILTTMTQLMT